MSDKSTDELKAEERLKIEIPVEEESQSKPQSGVADEFQRLGRQFAETLQSAWNSEERQKMESEVRQGLRSFADEVDKVIREAKSSPTTAKVKDEAVEIKTKVESAELTQKAREGMVTGLRWLSEELGKLAERFNPTEKSPETAVPPEKDEA